MVVRRGACDSSRRAAVTPVCSSAGSRTGSSGPSASMTPGTTTIGSIRSARRDSFADECGATDAAGYGYVSGDILGEQASANVFHQGQKGRDSGGCAPPQYISLVSIRHHPLHFPNHAPSTPGCPASNARVVFYGLLGPDATSITYRKPGGAARDQAHHRRCRRLPARVPVQRGDLLPVQPLTEPDRQLRQRFAGRGQPRSARRRSRRSPTRTGVAAAFSHRPG